MMSLTKQSGLKLFLFVICFSLFALFFISQVRHTAAQEQDTNVTDDDVNRVASQLFCPTCESVPVDVCPTEVCTDWRNEIRRQLAEGASDEEILNYFATRFGSGVLANPPVQGFGLLIWGVPLLLLLAGAAWFGRYLNLLRLSTHPPSSATADEPVSSNTADIYRQKVEQELKSH